MPPCELYFAKFAQQLFRPDTEVFLLRDEQTQLVRQIQIGFIVGRCGQQDATTIVLLDVFTNCPIDLSLAVAQVVTLIDQHNAMARQFRQLFDGSGHGEDGSAQSILNAIVRPHLDEVLRT